MGWALHQLSHDACYLGLRNDPRRSSGVSFRLCEFHIYATYLIAVHAQLKDYREGGFEPHDRFSVCVLHHRKVVGILTLEPLDTLKRRR